MASQAEIGLISPGVMGQNIARRAIEVFTPVGVRCL